MAEMQHVRIRRLVLVLSGIVLTGAVLFALVRSFA